MAEKEETSMPSFGMNMNMNSEELNALIHESGLLQGSALDLYTNAQPKTEFQGMQTSMTSQPQPTLTNAGQPYVEIFEQPKQRGLRFRYKCEGRSAGSIPGANSCNEHRSYPTIKINNYDGQSAIVVVSCVTVDDPPRPHPHSLVGKDCNKGVCTVRLKNSSHTVSFPNLGVQCATRKAVKEQLEAREKIRVDPFGTGCYKDINKIDLNIVRLCFQVFLPDENNKFTRIVQPVVSDPIYDKKAVNDLIICRLSRQSGCAAGGDEVFLLCEKVNKDDIQVRFFQESNEGTVWENYGEFAPNDVHRQFAIVCKTPPYKDQFITQPVQVFVQLVRPSDDGQSDPKPFQYIPDDPDPDGIITKRKRKMVNMEFFNNAILPPVKDEADTGAEIRRKLRATVSRSKKREEPTGNPSAPPQYTFENITGQQQNAAAAAFTGAPQQHQPTAVMQTGNQMPIQYQQQTDPVQIAPNQLAPTGFQGGGLAAGTGNEGLPQRIDYVNTEEEVNSTNSAQILQFLTEHMDTSAGQTPNIAELTNYLQMPAASEANVQNAIDFQPK